MQFLLGFWALRWNIWLVSGLALITTTGLLQVAATILVMTIDSPSIISLIIVLLILLNIEDH